MLVFSLFTTAFVEVIGRVDFDTEEAFMAHIQETHLVPLKDPRVLIMVPTPGGLVGTLQKPTQTFDMPYMNVPLELCLGMAPTQGGARDGYLKQVTGIETARNVPTPPPGMGFEIAKR